jgi:hypothetical protein
MAHVFDLAGRCTIAAAKAPNNQIGLRSHELVGESAASRWIGIKARTTVRPTAESISSRPPI